MSCVDVNQARRYIEILRNNNASPVHWQLFVDSKQHDPNPVVFYSNIDDALQELNNRQKNGYGVYVTLNPTDGKGRSKTNIIRFDWIFADIDGQNIPLNFPLLPAMVCQRDKNHGHVYWPITGCRTEKEYNYIQRMVSLYLGSDQSVVDTTRVARLPGSIHLKDQTDPKQYYISVDNNLDYSYDIDEFKDAFKLTGEKSKELENWISNRDQKMAGDGYNDTKIYRQQFIDFLVNNAEPATEGSGSATMIRVCGYAYDRGIPADEACEIMWEHYNPLCNPPWEDDYKGRTSFKTYVDNGYATFNNTPGCMVANIIFAGRVTPEPPGGWDENKKLKRKKRESAYDKEMSGVELVPLKHDIARISEEQAALNETAITHKSQVFDLGLKFLGESYPNKTLIRTDKMIYGFNGIHWEVIPDDFIKHEISIFFAVWKFAPSKITNIFDSICHNIYVKNLVKGQYMTKPNPKLGNSIIVGNGIIDIDENGVPTLKPHDSDLFDLNALLYDYDPNATCPEFLKFINAQWPGDSSMHDQLQELYGLSLINDNRYQVLPLMLGKSRSGKGVHATVMKAMVGTHNICSPSLEGILDHQTLYMMSTKKLAIIPEANSLNINIRGRVLDQLKAISGGDSLDFRRIFKDSTSNSVWPLTMITSNEMPDFIDSSGALSNRIWAFPFTRSFVGKEDINLSDRLCDPKSISGIFIWAIQGLSRIIRNGKVTTSSQSKELVEDIRYDFFPLSDFIDECCDIDETQTISVDDLHDAYMAYSRSKGVKTPYMQSKFSKLLKSSWLPVDKIRDTKYTNGKRHYIFTGIKLNEENKDLGSPIGFKPVISNVTPIKKTN